VTIKLAGTKFRLSDNFTVDSTNIVSLSGTVAGITSAYAYGAKGNGLDDDTAALNAAAMASAGSCLYVPAGTYPVKGFVVPANTKVICDPGTTFVPFDSSDLTSANFCINLAGDNIVWSGGTVSGNVSTTYGAPPTPYYGLKIQQTTGDSIPQNITIRDLTVVGCREGIWAIGSDGLTIENVTVDRCYQWGMAFPAPCTKRLRVDGFRAYDTGLNEGLKIASLYQQTGDASADILLTNLHIEGCGGLDPTSSNWQNGIDCFISAAQRLEISNFNLVGNYGGGIEIKRNHAPDITPNEYKNVRIQNGHITVTEDGCSGIALNITTPSPTSADTARQVAISGVQFDYTGGAAPSSVNGISMNAWTDVTISDCQFFGEFTRAINPGASGSYDSTLRRVTISDCVVKGATNGFSMTSGVVDRLVIMDGHFVTSGEAVIIGSSVTGSGMAIQGGVYESSGGSTPAVTIGGNVTGCVIRGADVRGQTYAIRCNNGGGDVHDNRLTSATDEAMRVSGGTWNQFKNEIFVGSTKSAYVTTAGTIASYMNSRGSDTTTPTVAAKVGEIVWNSTPSAGGTIGWVCTTAGTSPTWKAFGAVAS